MRIVLDTNILVSHLFWSESMTRHIIRRLMEQNEIVRSTETFAELAEVVMRRKFDRYTTIAERELFLAAFHDATTHVVISERIEACRDPKDNKFLELAVCGKAALVLSGDRDVRVLDPFRGIRILTISSCEAL